jgi:hypothetical protein
MDTIYSFRVVSTKPGQDQIDLCCPKTALTGECQRAISEANARFADILDEAGDRPDLLLGLHHSATDYV